jgi:hypothetical protein
MFWYRSSLHRCRNMYSFDNCQNRIYGLYFIVFQWLHLLVDIINVKNIHGLLNMKLITHIKSPVDHNNKNEAAVKLIVLKRRLYRLQYNWMVTVAYYAVQFPLHFRVFLNVHTFRHTRNIATETVIYCWKICDIIF